MSELIITGAASVALSLKIGHDGDLEVSYDGTEIYDSLMIEHEASPVTVSIHDFERKGVTWQVAVDESLGPAWTRTKTGIECQLGFSTDYVNVPIIVLGPNSEKRKVLRVKVRPMGALFAPGQARSEPQVEVPTAVELNLHTSLLRVFHSAVSPSPVVVMTRRVAASTTTLDVVRAMMPGRVGEPIELPELGPRGLGVLIAELAGDRASTDAAPGGDPGAYLKSVLESEPSAELRQFADTLISEYQLPLAMSPQLFLTTLRDLLASPESNAMQAAFVPIVTGAVASGMGIWNGQWAVAMMAPIVGSGASFVLVGTVWILRAIAEKPAWPEDRAKDGKP